MPVRCRRTPRRITCGYRTKDPDLWPKILFALRRTIRLHRRLMKIAPAMFDYGIRNKLERENEERARRWREIKPLMDKVYDSRNQAPITARRLATGLETNLKQDPAEALPQREVYEDLERIYGNTQPFPAGTLLRFWLIPDGPHSWTR